MNPDKFEQEYKAVEFQFIRRFQKKPSLEAMLLMIGFQECPSSTRKRDKEEKLDLINLGTLVVLEKLGFFRRVNKPGEWPEFEPTEKQSTEEKMSLMRQGIVRYFKDSGIV